MSSYTEKDVNKGLEAEKLLSNKTLMAAFGAIEKDYFEKFSSLKSDDLNGMAELNRKVHALEDLKEKLEHFASTGRIAKTQLEKLKNKVGL